MKSIHILLIAATSALVSSCTPESDDADASGAFEAHEIVVSAETSGRILSFPAQEGDVLDSGALVASIDSVQLHLKRLQLLKNKSAVQTRRPDVARQIAAIQQQIATARTERERVQRLLAANAANRKQLDDIDAQIAVLARQLDAQKSTLETTDKGIGAESDVLSVQVAQIDDQLDKCRVRNPFQGTLLVKYAERGELASAGKPLYRLADLRTMVLRAYVTAEQMSKMKLGQVVEVRSDLGDSSRTYRGTVSWISAKAEFTPKTIQTRDERQNLVYATKVSVENDGFLKIGMYGSLKLD